MGKLAKALGINMKGTATISIHKDAYHPGQVVVGQVNLRINRPLDGNALVLSVVGKERLKYETTRVRHEHNKRIHETTYHNQKLTLFESKLVVAPPQHYEPGDYVFPFQCNLPMDLPASLTFRKSSIQDMSNFRAVVNYKLSVDLPLSGMFRADIGGKKLIHIKAIENIVPRSARATRSQPVELLGIFNQGTCDFTARLRSDVLRIGQEADVRCSVGNNSKKRVSSISTLLYQDIVVKPIEGGGSAREYTYTVNETAHPGFEPGLNKDVKITPVIRSNHPIHELLPSHNGNLFKIGYRMRVKCSYTLCPSTKVEFPVSILA